jgi:hypothetical protein
MRHFPLMLYASAENRDWGVGCIESRSSSSSCTYTQLSVAFGFMQGGKPQGVEEP